MSGHDIESRLASVRERVVDAATRVGSKPEEITLVGVAKRKPAELIVAAVRAGLRDLAENYVQEAAAKIPAVNAELGAAGLAGLDGKEVSRFRDPRELPPGGARRRSL